MEGDNAGETVRCVHCRTWTGSAKTLSRKKDHLLRCPQYADWRAAGNGQELAPPNTYNKRDSVNTGNEAYSSPYQGANGAGGGSSYAGLSYSGPAYTSTVDRARNQLFTKYFDEFTDDDNGQKCSRVRCQYCGYVRAKNTTRQVEHMLACKEFLDSNEGQQALASGDLQQAPAASNSNAGTEIWRGGAPNPNLFIDRRAPAKARTGNAAKSTPQRLAVPAPSLVNFLLSKDPEQIASATQTSFLSHAGCGSLSASAIDQWLAQSLHISRALVPFVGSLIGKIRIPETSNLQQDPTYRAMDLLISAVQNMKKELEFLEQTRSKYGLQGESEEPRPAIKGIVDLFAAAAAPQASLLEGIVLLFAVEHVRE